MSDSESDESCDSRELWTRQMWSDLKRPVIESFASGGLNDNNMLQIPTTQFTQQTLASIITVDSQHRDQQVYPSPSSFKLKLPRSYRNISRIDIVQLKFFCGLYTLTAAKNNTTVTILDSNFNKITVKIPDGTYSTSSLAKVLSTLLTAAGTFKYTVTYDLTTGRFNILSPNNSFRILFITPQNKDSYMDWGLGWNMGFGGKPVDLPASELQTAAYFPRLTIDYLYLQLNPTENMNTIDTTGIENLAVSHVSTGITDAYFGKLLLNDFGSYSQNFLQSQKIYQTPLSRLDTLTFNWVDKFGNTISVYPESFSCDWNMTLRIFEVAEIQKDLSTIIRSS